MRDRSLKKVALLIAILYLSAHLPITAGAVEAEGFRSLQESGATEPLMFPPQEEGKITIAPQDSKSWYKKWWVWTIIVGIAAGAAAAAGGDGGGGGAPSTGSATITQPLP